MKIALFDHNYDAGSGSAWFRALHAHRLITGGDAKSTHKPPSNLTDPGQIIFCHQQVIRPWISAVLSNGITGHLVIVSSNGGITELEESDRIHSCFWKPEDFEAGAKPEVRIFLKSLSETKPKWQFLQPTSVPEKVLECALVLSVGNVMQVPEDLRVAAIEEFNTHRKAVRGLHGESERRGICDERSSSSPLGRDLATNAPDYQVLEAFKALIGRLRQDI